MSIDFGTDIYEESIVAKTFLAEDTGETSLRPHTLAEYIGQEKAKQNLSIFIEAARRRTESLDHVLLHGPPTASPHRWGPRRRLPAASSYKGPAAAPPPVSNFS